MFKKSTEVTKINTPFELRNTAIEKEIKNFYRISMTKSKMFKIFCMNACPCFRKGMLKDDSNYRLDKLYKLGTKRLDEDLSIERIVKGLRDVKILVKQQFLDEKLKFEIYHNRKNVLDLEDDDVVDCDVMTAGSANT